MNISQAMIDLVLDVASRRYRARPWTFHAATTRACIRRGLIEETERGLRLTTTGWAVAGVGSMLRAEQRESRRLASELYSAKRSFGGAP